MRNAIELENNLVLTTDNSGGIGEKPQDVVHAPNAMTAAFAARVTVLEQWAAHAEVLTTIIHNFSGSQCWEAYKQGVQETLAEAGLTQVQITGSSETNMELHQSALSVTMIGRQQPLPVSTDGQWFMYGKPFVGHEVIEHAEQVASLKAIYHAIQAGWIQQVWPTGSKGILAEVRQLFQSKTCTIQTSLDVMKTCGPSTVVLLRIAPHAVEACQQHFGQTFQPLKTDNR